MTTLYRPVKITSAEQAEALPVGTIAIRGASHPEIARKARAVLWESEDQDRGNRHMVGWTALVPIEAEEEQVAVGKASDGTETCYNPDAASHPVFGGYIGSLPIRARLVTPWEEA